MSTFKISIGIALNLRIPPMSSSSSVSSCVVGNRGLPLKCVCGLGVTIFTSKTPENPGRPFFRCNSKRDAKSWTNKRDGHLFKWVEDGVLEEVQDALARFASIDNEIRKAKCEANESNVTIQELQEEAKMREKEIGKLRLCFKLCFFWLCLLTIVIFM